MAAYYGSICITDCKDSGMIKIADNGKLYLNIKVYENQNGTDDYGNTHYITCAPKKEERIEGRKYTIGRLKTFNDFKPYGTEDINNMPSASINDIPF